MVDESKKIIRVALAIVMSAVIAVSAQLNFKIGPVPYTMQNFGVILSGLILGPYYGALAVIIYLAMIAIGLPFAAGGGGIGVLMGYTSGYLFGFVLTAFLAGIFRNRFENRPFMLWLSTFTSAIPTYLLGFAVFYKFAVGSSGLSAWAMSAVEKFGIPALSFPFVIFSATVLIYIPQDMLVDHLFAVLAYRYVKGLIRERGIEL